MTVGWMVAVASAATVDGADGQVWMMPGTVDCGASEVLLDGIDDGVLEPFEARRVGLCDHTTAIMMPVMGAFQATRDGIEAHADEPEALALYARAVGTYRSGLVGDGIRLALQLQIAEALDGAEAGPWQDTVAMVAQMEPGPMPGEDPPVLGAMLREGGFSGPDDGSLWGWGRKSVQSAYYLAMLPLLRPFVDEAQRALDDEDPRAALKRVDEAWADSWIPSEGYVAITLDLLEQEEGLRQRWDDLLHDM